MTHDFDKFKAAEQALSFWLKEKQKRADVLQVERECFDLYCHYDTLMEALRAQTERTVYPPYRVDEQGNVTLVECGNCRALARQHHPDGGGNAAKMAEVNGAIAQARKEKGRAA